MARNARLLVSVDASRLPNLSPEGGPGPSLSGDDYAKEEARLPGHAARHLGCPSSFGITPLRLPLCRRQLALCELIVCKLVQKVLDELGP